MIRSTRNKLIGVAACAIFLLVFMASCQPRYSPVAPMMNAPAAMAPAGAVAPAMPVAPVAVGGHGGGMFDTFLGSLAGSTAGTMLGNALSRRGSSDYHYDNRRYSSPVTTTSPAFRSTPSPSYRPTPSYTPRTTSSFTNSRGVTTSVTRPSFGSSGRTSFRVGRR